MSLKTCPQTGELIAFSDPTTCVILSLDALRLKLERNHPITATDRSELITVLGLASQTLDEYWHKDCAMPLDEIEGEDFDDFEDDEEGEGRE